MLSVIPAPKGVVQHIINIQRDFLWGKGEEKNKWALVAWGKMCKPKTHGRLEHHDPEILNKVLGEKLWWRWLKDSAALRQRYGNRNMQTIGKKGNTSECLESSKPPTSGTKLGRIDLLFKTQFLGNHRWKPCLVLGR